jgi:RimJ/RimL family protein N-acetyltransferase
VSDVLRTGRLRARRPEPADLDGYSGLLLDPEVEPLLRSPAEPRFGEATVRRWLADDQAHWDEHRFGPWALIELETGAMVGRGGLKWTEVEGRAAVELPWAIASRHWNRGFATEAATAALEWAGSLGLEQVIALVEPGNAASCRVAEKIGMREEGQAVHAGLPHLVYRTTPPAPGDAPRP